MNYIERIQKAYDDNRPETEMSREDFLICSTILKANQPEMNMDVNELDKNSEIYLHFKDLIESFSVQVFLRRLAFNTQLKISLGALIMLFLSFEGPGKAVMTVYYLHRKIQPNTLINMEVFCRQAFPWGMFNDEQFAAIWAAQKKQEGDDVRQNFGAPDNLLDYIETWK